jgi:AcrR family transcriptional regulator
MKNISVRQEQANLTHKRIYNVALLLFAKKGFDNVSVDDICLKAHISKGAFYLHFKSKHALAVEQFTKTDMYLKDTLIHEIKTREQTEDKLLTYALTTCDYLSKAGASIKKTMFQIQLMSEKHVKVIPENSALYTILESIIKSARQKKELRNDKSVKDITSSFLRAYQGLILEWCVSNGNFDLVDEGKNMFPIVWDGIRKR